MTSQMTISRKISLVSALSMVFILTLGVVALVSIGRMRASAELIITDSLPGVYESGRMESIAKDIQASMLTHIGSDQQSEMGQQEALMAQQQQKLTATLKDYEKTITTARDRELFEKISPAFDRYMRAWEKPRTLSRALKTQQALALFYSETVPAMTEFLKTVSDESEFNKANGDEFSRQAVSVASTGRLWTWAILIVAIVCNSVLAFFTARSITDALVRSVSELHEGAGQVAAAAGQISSSSQSLAQGASEQAASLEETSASSEEINSMAHKNAENSQAANTLVSQSQQKFAETNQSLELMVVAMGDIKASSDKVAKIIKVIDEIAFQTNILALNAAVEAARAGEAGMGFAVVADEVRNLAQRCAQAANDTADLIEESIAKSNEGKTKVDQVAVAIRAITEESSKVKTLVDEVNLGSQEQTRGIEQVAKALTQMERVTQQSAANAEESAAAAEQLTAQASTLMDVVGQLSAMVGGAETSGGGSHHGTSSRNGSSGLSSLQKAVGKSANIASPKAAPAHKSASSFALDEEEFKEML